LADTFGSIVREQVVEALDAPVDNETDDPADDRDTHPEQEVLIQYEHAAASFHPVT
jgi:hypothetical protein